MREAFLLAQRFKGLLSISNGTRVAPDDGGAQCLLILVDTHQSVHLVGDADGFDVGTVYARFGQDGLRSLLQVCPPAFWVLLSPSLLHCQDGCLALWKEGRGYTLAAFGIYQARLYGRTTYVIT